MEFIKICNECLKGREYVIRHKKNNIDEIDENEYDVVYEDDPNWDGSGVLMVILDGGAPITLDMLRMKRDELLLNPPPPTPTDATTTQLMDIITQLQQRLNKVELLEQQNKLLLERLEKININ